MNAHEQHKPFQVDLRGVVDLLSKSIYSSPRVYLRELLQNCCDAIAARAEFDASAVGAIRITPLSPGNDVFTIHDNGIGLTPEEAGLLLSTVGRSSKRDMFDLPRSDYLGQFGIGLLSCFMVADRIVVRSRSAKGGPAVEWIGNSEGTFSVQELTDEPPVGTSVTLIPRFDEAGLLGTSAVLQLTRLFGEFLPVDIVIDLPGGGVEQVTHEPIFVEPVDNSSRALIAYGTELIGAEPFDVIELSAPATGTHGVAFVLPFSRQPGARQAHRVYLGRMLLGERVDEILPDWAFFARAVINTTGLNPTASREAIVADEALEYTRNQLGAALRRWVMQLGLAAPYRLAEFVAIHDVALKSLILHDDELAQFLTKWLPLETSVGRLSIETLVARHPNLRYAETLDEFRQIAGIARPDRPVINGGYVYDAEIIRLLPSLFNGVTVERVSIVDELDTLEVAPLDDHSVVRQLEERGSAVLTVVDCAVVVRSIDEVDVPAVYVADPEILRAADRSHVRRISSRLWDDILGKVDHGVGHQQRGGALSPARLCLNWKNPVVQMLARLDDEAVFSRSVQLLYVQSLLAGHRPLSVADRVLMTTSLTDLILLSVGLGAIGRKDEST